MIKLTNEEIAIEIEELRNRIPEFTRGLYLLVKSSNKAQLKKVVEWGELYCTHDNGGMAKKRWACPICRQALLEESR